MTRVIAFAGLLVACLAGSATAQFDDSPFGGSFGAPEAPKVFASAVVRDGNPAQLQVTAEVEPGWTIYSLTQKKGGPKATRIDLQPSPQYELAGKFVALSKPKISEKKDIWPGLPIEEHAGKITWVAPIKLASGVAADQVNISGEVVSQACSAEVCLDQTSPFATQGTSAEQAPPGEAEASLLPVEPNRAATEGVALFSEENVTLTGRVTKVSVQPGDTLELRVTASPELGWHVYALEADDTPKGISMPAQFAVTDRGGFRTGAAVADQAFKEKKLEWPEGAIDRYYQGPVTWTIPIEIPQDAAPGMHLIQGVAGFQACADDESGCRQPTGAEFAIDVYVGPAPPNADGAVRFAKIPFPEARKTAAATRADAVVGSDPTTDAAQGSDSNDNSAITLGGDSAEGESNLTAIVALPLAFLGGFILNFMPCVLPVIGLKVMSFVSQAGQDRRRVFMLNLWYVFGLISVFMVLACLAAFLNYGWAEQFQSPEFAVALAAIVFVFALSMLGVWEIPIPGFVGSGTAADMANQEGASGAFFKGVLTTVLATPCVGPFVVPVITWAAKQSQATTFLVFFLMGLGMASPYVVIGMFPKAVKFLPKPGAWMDTFKHLMGFVLLFTVVFIFHFLADDWRVPTLAMLIALWAGCWWIGRVPLTEDLGKKVRAWAVGGTFAAVVGFGSFAGYAFLKHYDKTIWQEFSPATLATLRSEQTPTLIDFTADWCGTCQYNKGVALYTAQTKDFMRSNGIVGLKADKTSDSPDIEALLGQLGNTSGGIPFYAVYPNDGGRPILLDGLLTQGKLMDALEKAVGNDTATPVSTVAGGFDTSIWKGFTPETLANLRSEKTPVLIAITADWSLTSQTDKVVALYTSETKAFMQENGIVGLEADNTKSTPEVIELFDQIGNRSGATPFYAIYPSDGGEPILLDALLTQSRLIEALEKAVDGRPVAPATTAQTARAGG